MRQVNGTENRFRTLWRIGRIFRALGLIVGGAITACLLTGCWLYAFAVLRNGWEIGDPPALATMFLMSLLGFILTVVFLLKLTALVLFGMGEAILMFIAIEENSRSEADANRASLDAIKRLGRTSAPSQVAQTHGVEAKGTRPAWPK